MIYNTERKWIADLRSMTCRNIENCIAVVFQKNGKAIEGKIQNMPMELLEKWAAEPHGERLIHGAVMEAEEVFMRAYNESGSGPTGDKRRGKETRGIHGLGTRQGRGPIAGKRKR